jgi:hypothetical protein
MGLGGKFPIPILHPLAYLGASVLGSSIAPIDLNYLRYPCVGDLRRMREELEFTPQYTSEEALREFAAQQRLRKYMPESAALALDEERLRDTIERRRRAREAQAGASARPRRKSRAPRAAVNPVENDSPLDMFETLKAPIGDDEENGHG